MDEPTPPREMDSAACVLEAARPLSRSLLWRLQRNFFARQGIQAWSEAVVPHYVTSNPWIADAYAKVVLGWLRDGVAAGTLDPGHPVHVVELGCGSGRFGYLFLNRLLDLLGRSRLSPLAIRYVLTDFTESNLDYLRSHLSLQGFIDAGNLDFACYDAGKDVFIRLSHSGEVLAPGTLVNPLAVLANYVFDGIPQDCFRLADGELFESLAILSSPRPELDLDDPELITRVELSWERRPVAGEAYGDPDLDRILAGYRERLSSGVVLLPAVALRCVRNLARLSGGRLLLLSGDKGYSREERVLGGEEPALAVHGSFSLMVNYHAIGRYFVDQGGEFLRTSHLGASLSISAGLLGLAADGAVETRLAFDDAVERRGPDDYFHWKTAFAAGGEAVTLAQLLAYFERSIEHYGPNPATLVNLGLCHFRCGRLGEALASAEEALAAEPELTPAVALRAAVQRTLDLDGASL